MGNSYLIVYGKASPNLICDCSIFAEKCEMSFLKSELIYVAH